MVSKSKATSKRHQISPTDEPTLARAVPLSAAFVAGWSVMMLEILGGRLLAPYFGYSVYQWGALIGVVLGFMALGYFLGGRVGDSPRAFPVLVGCLAASLFWALLSPHLGGLGGGGILSSARAFGPAWGSVVASAVLLGPPSLCLAVVSPIVVRLTAQGGIASSAGTVYGVSTLGSIGGTFFAAFYAIPVIGTSTSYYLAAVLLLVIVLALVWAGRRFALGAAPAAALMMALVPLPEDANETLYSAESLHNIIRVEDRAESRLLYLNYRQGPQTIERKGELLTGSYYDLFLLGPQLAGAPEGRKVRDLLFLGAAGGVALKQAAEVWPARRIVGVELDPAVIEVARDYFGLADRPRIELVAEDARWFVEWSGAGATAGAAAGAGGETGGRFDVAAVDLYVTGHIPFFTTTVEFFRALHGRLEDDGVMMMNVLSVQPGEDLIGPMVNTVRDAFPSVFLVGYGNIMLIATKRPMTLEQVRARLKAADLPEAARPVARRALKTLRAGRRDTRWPVFTDDLNDVDFRSFRMFYGG